MVLLKFCFCIFTVFVVLFHAILCQLVNSPVELSDNQFGSIINSTKKGLVANFQSNGIKGYAFFYEDNGDTIIKIFISGPYEDVYNWKIYSAPTDLNADHPCSAFKMRTQLNQIDLTSIFGPIPSEQEKTYLSNHVQLVQGESSVLGTTLFLRGNKSGKVICSTLLPNENKTIYLAKFHYPINGQIVFFQYKNITTISSDLSYSNGIREMNSHRWILMEGFEQDSTYEAQYHYETTVCSNFRGRPLFINMHESDPINIGIDTRGASGKSFSRLRNLIDFDSFSIIYILVYSESNKIIACAPLHRINKKIGSAKFISQSVKGIINFAQESPFEPTLVNINIELSQLAYSYGIDELPKIIRTKDETNKACPNIQSIIFNPKNIDPDVVPQEAMGTSDLYAVGDLSGKYGHLANKNKEVLQIYDYNLPLFGKFSIIGRALVIYSPEGRPIACSNIELIGTNITTAFATFDTPIQGQFIFRQPLHNCTDDTYVYLEISKPNDNNAEKTNNHQWIIHRNNINPGSSHWSTNNCSQIGPHFNPYNVSTDCIYFRDCNSGSPLRCELGDTTSKLGPINIPPYNVNSDGDLDIGKYFFVDTFLPLCGPASIINRSLTVYSSNYGQHIISCANIIEYKPRYKTRTQTNK